MESNSASLSTPNLHGHGSQLVEQEEKRQDLGFGTKVSDTYQRLINKDGSFNTVHKNDTFWDRLNIYNRLITMGWVQFLSWVLVFYLIANGIFAGIYLLAGADNLASSSDKIEYSPFWKAFFFSSQTLTTVGYGHIAPVNFLTSVIAAFESMMGLLSFALVTGLLYGRFSRPSAHIRFSRQAVFAPYLDVNGWMFRIINARANQLIEVQIQVSMSRLETKADGSKSRKYYSINLERNSISFFPANWTLVHPITDASPLHGVTPEDLAESEAEFLILLRAVEDTFSQTVHRRYSYRFDEIQWGKKFRPMVDNTQPNWGILDLDMLDETEDAMLN